MHQNTKKIYHNMTEVLSYKPLEQAIENGEETVKVTSTKFLLACAVAEKCDFEPANIDMLISLVMDAKNGCFVKDNPHYTFPLLNSKGRTFRMPINLTILSVALRVMQILNDKEATVSLQKDENGNLTGVMNISK